MLQNQYDNYIPPFFWQHGEDDEVLIEELEKLPIRIRAVCVESRPHEGFVVTNGGKTWILLFLRPRRGE